jgi:hypothetical protein
VAVLVAWEKTGRMPENAIWDVEMKILVACEFSGRVRDAFTELGHKAISCDLIKSESPGAHYTGDVFNIIHDS